MIIALSLAALALWAATATVVVVSRDSYRRVPTATVARSL
jgi:hypothetical protein